MNENETTVTNSEQERDTLDIKAVLSDFYRSFRRLWWLVIALTIAGALLFYFRVRRSYSPSYVAEATVSVELVNGGSYANRNTAEQMGLIFPYILSSGVLSDVVADDLQMSSIPGVVNAVCIKGTNLLTVTVSGWDPELSYRTLQSVLKNYPEVAQYVVGQTKLTVIDDRGIPTDTGRAAVVRGSIKKGAIIGAILGLAIVELRSLMMTTIRSEEELRQFVNIPYLGTLPVCKRKERRNSTRGDINILFDTNRDEYIEAMRLVRTRIERGMGSRNVLMVTSSVAGEGKSTVSANLAASFALKGFKVVLVDCDLRNPSVGRIFNLTGDYPGLAAVLKGKSSIEDALVEVQKDGEPIGLTFMPGSSTVTRMAETLGSDEMGKLIDTLSERFDMVILDTPPSAVLFDAMMLVRHVDGVAYVIMHDYARRRYIVRGIKELAATGAPITGFIINGGRSSSGKYGYYGRYGGRYGYYGRYGYGYGSKKSKSEKSSR